MDLIAGKSPSNDDSGRGECRKGVKYLVDTTPCMRVLPAEYVLPLQPEKLISSSRVAIPIINHGVKVSLMEEMLKVVDGFFNLAAEEKMKYASEDVMNPVRYGTSLNTSQRHALHWRDYLRHFGHPIDNTFHLWPPNPSTYRVVAKEYLEEIWGLAIRISGAISEALGLEREYVEKSLGKGCQIVASNYYPPCPEPHRTLGLAAHSDHGGITILMQNEVDGLQVNHQGEWVAVHHVPGTLVVNIGDYIETVRLSAAVGERSDGILSNGKYKSVEHRAVVNAERTRISIAVGHGPEMTATVAPASPLVDEKSLVKYRPIMYKDYMRAQQSSAVRGKSPLQALMTNTTIFK
ncbi:hypothetical protein RHMOL_Rhmol04G0089500 [Rhododendron molle]|uniref:Uncharacterized protein n=1 Tax=Rhododendron molle TaxID=49168 RepID=A0ACC0P0V4_RHOML|nr:hypothetical protein RHMOL_Rhmol04G0089500 [Rhododendron molle]